MSDERKGCLSCGAPRVRWQKSDYCSQCRRLRCQHCRCLLEPSRLASNRCLQCRRDQDSKNAASDKRQCCQCRAPLIGRKQSTCPPCASAMQQRYLAALAADTQRHCSECKEPVGEHRTTPRCKACHKAYRARKRERHGRRCSICGVRLVQNDDSRCRECLRLYQNWWSDYRRGSPEARLLGKKRSNNRYVGRTEP
jgi:hypothetical protein